MASFYHVLPTDNSRCIMDAFPPSDGINPRFCPQDLRCETSTDIQVVSKTVGVFWSLNMGDAPRFLVSSWGILGIHHVFFCAIHGSRLRKLPVCSSLKATFFCKFPG